ncbi:MAG TPA: class I SAM-dependent methyltransferase, partial [Candidatus Methylomirabilis sp.]|nr:class I SAM-dependent methyltransferase [Candidatus Methylomirabilis sp.]
MSDNTAFFQEYTSPEAVAKYTRATAGFGVSYLLDHDYKRVYLQALRRLPRGVCQRGIRMLEFGCGGGMNLIHLVSVLDEEGIRVEKAIGTDFSPVLIEEAHREARSSFGEKERQRLAFHVVDNGRLLEGLLASGLASGELRNSFHFVLGVNTIRYCHAAGRELQCARDIFDLLTPGGICVAIDMNNRYPLFRSDLKRKLRRRPEEEECYVPTLEEYTAPFSQAGFEVVRSA